MIFARYLIQAKAFSEMQQQRKVHFQKGGIAATQVWKTRMSQCTHTYREATTLFLMCALPTRSIHLPTPEYLIQLPLGLFLHPPDVSHG